FGELCRALALKIFREYDPDVVIGIAKAGVIPGALVASILQRDFASVAITRQETGARPVVLAGPPRIVAGRRVLIVDETCDSGDTMKLALNAVRELKPTAVKKTWSSAVTMRGRRLESATASEDQGGFVRALNRGSGWGTASFTSLDQLAAMVARADELSRAVRLERPIQLAPVPAQRAEGI